MTAALGATAVRPVLYDCAGNGGAVPLGERRLLIYGNGPQARVVYGFAARHADVAAFVVEDTLIDRQRSFKGLPLCGLGEMKARFAPSCHRVVVAVGYGEMNGIRQRVSEAVADLGYDFASYVDPSVNLPEDVEIGANCIVLDHVSVHAGGRIGRGTFVSSAAVLGHDCELGDYAWVGSASAIGGNVRIGRRCFLGVSAAISHGLSLGDECYVGAGATVVRDLPAEATILSEAARVLPVKSRNFLALTSSARRTGDAPLANRERNG